MILKSISIAQTFLLSLRVMCLLAHVIVILGYMQTPQAQNAYKWLFILPTPVFLPHLLIFSVLVDDIIICWLPKCRAQKSLFFLFPLLRPPHPIPKFCNFHLFSISISNVTILVGALFLGLCDHQHLFPIWQSLLFLPDYQIPVLLQAAMCQAPGSE